MKRAAAKSLWIAVVAVTLASLATGTLGVRAALYAMLLALPPAVWWACPRAQRRAVRAWVRRRHRKPVHWYVAFRHWLSPLNEEPPWMLFTLPWTPTSWNAS